MKVFTNKTRRPLISGVCLLMALFILGSNGYAQQDSRCGCTPAELKRAAQASKKYISNRSDH